MSEHWTDRISDYLDGDLAEGERLALEAHVATCDACARDLEALREVIVRARDLEDRPPAADLWPGIEARIAPPRRVVLPGRFDVATKLARRFSLTLPQLAAAGFVLAVMSAGAMWFVLHRAPVSPRGLDRGGPVATAPGIEAQAPTFETARYDAAVSELERVLRDHRAELDTSTVRVLEQNLALIDRATEQARQALQRDPANPYLNGHLAEQMQHKIRLLQRAADLVTAHS